MCSKVKLNHSSQCRQTERGAALVTVLLISTLLLSAGGVLLLTTSMSATNPKDSAAEMETYYAAEAGLQRTLNVMRSHDLPPRSIPGGKNKLSFRDVVLNPTLANWLPFNGPTIGGVRTTLVGTNAFSVVITDPDDQGPVPARRITRDLNYDPQRVNIVVTSYGPKRARKVLNMLVLRGGLNGFRAPATITLRGAEGALPPPLAFDTGDSNAVRYTGNDGAGGSGISAFAVTVPDVPPTFTGIQRPTQIEGSPVSVLGPTSPFPDVPPTPTPEWLETADAARGFVNTLREAATDQSRYFTTQPATENMGTTREPKLTFIDGDVDLGPGNQGTGLLVITGKVTMKGNTSFNGLILVLGEGSVERAGAGNGLISGGIVIAKFGSTGDFLAPTFTTNGGGNSRIQYNSNDFSMGTNLAPGFTVLGVVEK